MSRTLKAMLVTGLLLGHPALAVAVEKCLSTPVVHKNASDIFRCTVNNRTQSKPTSLGKPVTIATMEFTDAIGNSSWTTTTFDSLPHTLPVNEYTFATTNGVTPNDATCQVCGDGVSAKTVSVSLCVIPSGSNRCDGAVSVP